MTFTRLVILSLCCLVVQSEGAGPVMPWQSRLQGQSVESELRRLEYRVITDHMKLNLRLDSLNNTLGNQCLNPCEVGAGETSPQQPISEQATSNTEDNTEIMSTVELVKRAFLREKEMIRDNTATLDDKVRSSIAKLQKIDIQYNEISDKLEALTIKTEERLGQLDQAFNKSISNLEERLRTIGTAHITKESTGPTDHKHTCEEDWILFQSSCYSKVYSKKLTRGNAYIKCMRMHAYLVEIESAAENKFVHDRLHGSDTRIWIGLERADGGTWTLRNARKTATFLNWSPGEPNDDKGGENCAEMFGSNGKWNDMACNERRKYMCEKPALLVHV